MSFLKYNSIYTILLIMILSGEALFLTGCYGRKNRPDSPEIKYEYGTMTDIDGNSYKTVKIGSQWWMAENLKVTHYRDGTEILNITDSLSWCNLTVGEYSWYNNNPVKYKSLFGAFYNWSAVVDSRNIAPSGWHVPTSDEWYKLTYYLNSGAPVAAGSKLTAPDGFAAIACGLNTCRNCEGCKVFDEAGQTYYWWTITPYDSLTAIRWEMSNSDIYMGIDSGFDFKAFGFSVRCIKDN